jgi:phenylalanyl-tRNA synthetase beta chain
MPTIEINYAEFEQTLGREEARCRFGNPQTPDLGAIDEVLSFVKAEVKAYDAKEGVLSIEMKDTARADLWSVEGLIRALRGYLGQQKGIKLYTADKSDVEVNVDTFLFNIRPYICCAVVKDIHLSDEVIKGIMHLQDKLDHTHGRSRRRTSIGIYNLDLIKPPIKYTAVKPEDVQFVPLGFTEKMGLDEILEKHPKGQEYGHIVKKNPLYPMLYDSEGKVLSFPPIINSSDLGKITEDSCNLLIEVTGTLHKTVLNTLTLVTSVLIDHGGKAYSVTIHYPKGAGYTEETVVTPDFSSRRFELSVAETNRLLGLKLSAEEIAGLLGTAGLGVEKASADSLTVLVPCYRVDVMHQVDIIEDVAIAYGYNNITSLWREMPTTGKAKADQRCIDIARGLMVGLGYQEVLNTTLTSPDTLFQKMNQPPTRLIELSNPKVITMTCLRNQLLPGLIEFLSINQSVEFPQKIFELGKVTLPDESKETRTRDEDWLAAVTAHPNANFSEIKSALDSFMANFGVEWQIQEAAHPSFIEGRAGKILVDGKEVGVVGEVSPVVLEAWKLENPAAAFELHLQIIIEDKQKK